jgi:hypothetical protein
MKQQSRLFFSRLLLFVALTGLLAGCGTKNTARKDNSTPKENIVRGVTYAGFASMTQLPAPTDTLLPTMWKLWKTESWNALDTLVTKNKISGGYPPANGFVNVDTITLRVDKQLDRYGSLYGNFLADAGASYGGRSLPAGSEKRTYYKFKVIKPIPKVLAGKAIPWFGEPGMGMQYMTPYKINVLIADKYLVITDSVAAGVGK